MASYCEVMPWYCCNALAQGWLESCIPDSSQQASMMSFGPNMDASVAAQAKTDTKNWLDSIGFAAQRQSAIDQDNANSWFPTLPKLPDVSAYVPLLIAVGVIGLVAIGGSGSRRYGR